jgi:hypothetical protein
MNLQFGNQTPIDGTRLLTPQRVLLVSLALIIASWPTYAISLMLSEGLNLRNGGPPVGGDYVAFWAAAKAAAGSLQAAIYDPAFFESWLHEIAMEREYFGLSWQYPPTYYLLILPLAFLPFVAGFALWSGGTMALYGAALRWFFDLRLTGFIVLLGLPVVFNAFITGQNGFLTATLLLLAGLLPDKRPVVAGIAAGMLTIKPQLGVLLPIAYIAAGCWRAFFTAAFVAVAMVGLSLLAFGAETWQAFFNAILGVGDGMQREFFPMHKMITVFAAFYKSGVPTEIAMGLQVLSTLAVMGGMFYVWRKVKEADLRAASLFAAVFLCTPYAYYYEMTILVLPLLIIVKRAMQTGWQQGEEMLLICLWAGTMLLPLMPEFIRAQFGLVLVGLVLWMTLRRGFNLAMKDAVPAMSAG